MPRFAVETDKLFSGRVGRPRCSLNDNTVNERFKYQCKMLKIDATLVLKSSIYSIIV